MQYIRATHVSVYVHACAFKGRERRGIKVLIMHARTHESAQAHTQTLMHTRTYTYTYTHAYTRMYSLRSGGDPRGIHLWPADLSFLKRAAPCQEMLVMTRRARAGCRYCIWC